MSQHHSPPQGMRKYKKLKYLGKGSYGAALLVELKSNSSEKFVIKEILIGHLKESEQMAAKKEAEVLNQLSHSNITMFIESFVEDSKLYIVMEYADGGDLSAAIQRRKSSNQKWTEEEIMRIFVQICLALKHVHDANILHRDLKSQNIFLTNKEIVKLGDFGIAKVLDASEEQARTQIGTPYYLSPEICESKPYGRQSDVWSLGIVLFELSALEMPFQASSLPALVHRIVSAEPSYSKIQDLYSSSHIELIKDLLNKNPDKRPNLKEIVQSDHMKAHISRLLSHTLKAVGHEAPTHVEKISSWIHGGGTDSNIDAEEIDRRIERARQHQREIEREKEKQNELQQKRQEEIEKLRKFKQEMISRKNVQGSTEGQVSTGAGEAGEKYDHAVADMDPGRAEVRRHSDHIGRVRGSAMGHVQAARRGSSPKRFEAEAPSGSNHLHQVRQSGVVAGGRGGLSLLQHQQQQQQTEYESYARREYFANRAAAQAMKNKVEAYERDSDRNASRSPYEHSNAVQVQQAGVSRDRERDNRDHHEAGGEARLAAIRAQKEREKQKEIMANEQRMKEAIQAQREIKREFAAAGGPGSERKQAVAFSVDFSDNDHQGNRPFAPPVLPSRRSQSKQSDKSPMALVEDDPEITLPRGISPMGNILSKNDGNDSYGRFNSQRHGQQEQMPSTSSNGGKKGWDRSRIEPSLLSEDIRCSSVSSAPLIDPQQQQPAAEMINVAVSVNIQSNVITSSDGVVGNGGSDKKGWAPLPADPNAFKVPVVPGIVSVPSAGFDDNHKSNLIDETATTEAEVADIVHTLTRQRLNSKQQDSVEPRSDSNVRR